MVRHHRPAAQRQEKPVKFLKPLNPNGEIKEVPCAKLLGRWRGTHSISDFRHSLRFQYLGGSAIKDSSTRPKYLVFCGVDL
ncbi:MAG: hypothetical protein M2R45_03245 [Verrucomicrobia subdivision 3 bacterium]|nr:hypothetical protein [Limisphaerales bacterium]MCS1416106.1 hypothetical protein [Limisphaerales bacterium]